MGIRAVITKTINRNMDKDVQEALSGTSNDIATNQKPQSVVTREGGNVETEHTLC